MSNLPARQDNQAIFARFAARFGLDSSKISSILKNTAFKIVDKNDRNKEVSDEQMAALLVVAEQFNLNPFVKEIYAFPDSTGRGIIPIVPIDGWTRIANEHPQYDGVEFVYSPELVKHGKNTTCPVWIEAIIYRKDRTRPTRVREYLEECARETTPWSSHPQRMLRHKAFMQCGRVAFSYSGIYDEEEGERIATARLVNMDTASPVSIDVTPEAKALPVGEAFENIIVQGGFSDQRDKVEDYLLVCAQHFQSSVEDVKAEAVRRPENFIKTFPAWLKSAEQQKKAHSTDAKTSTRGGNKSATTDTTKQQAHDRESTEIECAVYPGTTVRTGVECKKCERKNKDCAYWLAPGADQSTTSKE